MLLLTLAVSHRHSIQDADEEPQVTPATAKGSEAALDLKTSVGWKTLSQQKENIRKYKPCAAWRGRGLKRVVGGCMYMLMSTF